MARFFGNLFRRRKWPQAERKGLPREAFGSPERAEETDTGDAGLWLSKALALEALGRAGDAAYCYRQFWRVSSPDRAVYVERVRRRLRKSKGR